MKPLIPSTTNWIGDTFHPTFFPLGSVYYCEIYYEEMNCLERFVGWRNACWGVCPMTCGCRWEGAPEDADVCGDE